MTQIEPLQGKPALLVKAKHSYLVIADLHLGYELELRESGFNLPEQTNQILKSILEIERGDNLLMLGDIKHTIPFATKFESIGLFRFMKALSDRFSSITIISGNHDGGLKKVLHDSVNLVSSQGLLLDNLGFVHGHSWPSDAIMQSKTIVWSHIHPSVRLLDRMGAGVTMKCWLRGSAHPDRIRKRYPKARTEESIIIPAFNHLLTGSAVNESSDKTSSPLIRSGFVNLAEQKAYTLEGVELGEIGNLPRAKKSKSIK